MKHFDLALAIAFTASSLSFGCSSRSETPDAETLKVEFTQILPEILVGEWSCCQMGTSQSLTMMNVCPNLEFMKNRTGYWTHPSKERVPFDWELLNDSSLRIGCNDQSVFENGIYKMTFTPETEFVELQLTHRDIDHVYFLGKENGATSIR